MPKAKKKPTAKAERRPIVIMRPRVMRARYDAAQTTDDNRKHWANADALSANSALLPEVRRTLRNRSRYEVANNSYAKGIGLTIANDTVGMGPTLQLLTKDKDTNDLVERLVYEWACEIRLAEKLRQSRMARYDSGEAFWIFVNNPALQGPVKLDIQVIEAEQIANPNVSDHDDDRMSDGIGYDQYGNPEFYRKLKAHPGGFSWSVYPTDFDDISARFVHHYFRPDRPGQCRGIPDITPALTVFADLRRLTQAVIAANETAAEHAAVIETDASADPDGAAASNPALWDLVELEKRGGLVLPSGYKMSQLKSEHPSTNHSEFVMLKLGEISRCLCVPLHIASMDARLANMSSSYVIGQMYVQERKVDRCELDRGLNYGLDMWLTEATRIDGLIPELPPTISRQWNWPSLGHHADPQKVANALMTRISCGMASFSYEFAKDGLDVTEQHTKAAEELGISLKEYRELLRNKIFGPVKPEPAEEKTEPDNSEDESEGYANTSAKARKPS